MEVSTVSIEISDTLTEQSLTSCFALLFKEMQGIVNEVAADI